MPQINFYTYLSQTTWIIILFYLFYYLMKQYILPLVYENIKLKNLTINKTIENKQFNSTSSFNTTYNNSLFKFTENN